MSLDLVGRQGLVSVIIPAYNHAAYIRQCVDSVLSQTYRNVEAVVVDDGSIDGTYEILRTYGERIVLIRQPNHGTQAARNTAIVASSGEFIALLDSDDVWLPRKLECQMPVFEEHPDTALVYSYATAIDEHGCMIGSGARLGEDAPAPDLVFDWLLTGCHIPALTAVFRRHLLAEVGLFDETLEGAGDWDMWLKLAERWPVRCVPEPLAQYRIHPANTTKALLRTERAADEDARVIARYLEKPTRRPVSDKTARRAHANVELRRAECAAVRGASDEVGQHLADALALDSTLLSRTDWLSDRVLDWAAGGDRYSWPQSEQYAESVFGRLPACARVAHARRRVRAGLALARAFSLYGHGERLGLAEPLFLAVCSRPAYLTNRGVWSMLATLLLGNALKREMVRIVRRAQCLVSR